MKLTVNDKVLDNPQRLDLTFEIDQAGEEMGPIVVQVVGGTMTILPGEGSHKAALFVSGHTRGRLVFRGESAGLFIVANEANECSVQGNRDSVGAQGDGTQPEVIYLAAEEKP